MNQQITINYDNNTYIINKEGDIKKNLSNLSIFANSSNLDNIVVVYSNNKCKMFNKITNDELKSENNVVLMKIGKLFFIFLYDILYF